MPGWGSGGIVKTKRKDSRVNQSGCEGLLSSEAVNNPTFVRKCDEELSQSIAEGSSLGLFGYHHCNCNGDVLSSAPASSGSLFSACSTFLGSALPSCSMSSSSSGAASSGSLFSAGSTFLESSLPSCSSGAGSCGFGTCSAARSQGGLFGSSSCSSRGGGLFGDNPLTSCSSRSAGRSGAFSVSVGQSDLCGSISSSCSSSRGELFGGSLLTSCTSSLGGIFGSIDSSGSSSGGGLFGGDLCSSCRSSQDGLFGSIDSSSSSSGGGLFGSNLFTSCRSSNPAKSENGLSKAPESHGGLFYHINSSSSSSVGGLFQFGLLNKSGGCSSANRLFSTGSKLFDALGSQGGLFFSNNSDSSRGGANGGGLLFSNVTQSKILSAPGHQVPLISSTNSISSSNVSGGEHFWSRLSIPRSSNCSDIAANVVGKPGLSKTPHILIFLRTPKNCTIVHSLDPQDSVDDLMMAVQDKLGIPTHMQRLLIEGRQLRDISKTLTGYHLQRGSVVRVLERIPLRTSSGFVCIKMLKGGETFLVKTGEQEKVSDLIASIQKRTHVRGLELSLVFQGQRMLESSKLLDHNIKMGCLIHCISNKPLSSAESSKAKSRERADAIVKVENAFRKLSSSQSNASKVDLVRSINQCVEKALGADASPAALEARWKAKIKFYEAEKARRLADVRVPELQELEKKPWKRDESGKLKQHDESEKLRKRNESDTMQKNVDEGAVCKELEAALHGKDIDRLSAAVKAAQQGPLESVDLRLLIGVAEGRLVQIEKEAADEAEREERERRKRVQKEVEQRRVEAEARERAEKNEQRRLEEERKQKKLDRQREKDEVEKQRKELAIATRKEQKQRKIEEQQKRRGIKSRISERPKNIAFEKQKNEQDMQQVRLVGLDKEATTRQTRLSTNDMITQTASPLRASSMSSLTAAIEVHQRAQPQGCLEDGRKTPGIEGDTGNHKVERDSITTFEQESCMQTFPNAMSHVAELEGHDVMDVIDKYQVRADGYLTVQTGDKVFVHYWKGPDEYEINGWAFGSLLGADHKFGWLPQRVLALADSEFMEVTTPYEVGSEGYLALQLGQCVVIHHRREGDQYEATGWAYGEIKDRSFQRGWLPLRILSKRNLSQ